MQYRICPQCRNWNREQTVFCLFCGKPLHRHAARVSRETAHSPRVRATFARRAQGAFLVVALLAALISAFFPAISQASSYLSARFQTLFSPSVSVLAEPVDFSQSSGTYDVQIYLSQAVSDDAGTKSAADDIEGRRYSGAIVVAVDPSGTGSIQINQAFFSPKAIDVVPFTDESGHVSGNTLYGTIHQSGMKVSIVCVVDGGKISGFIWLDSDQSHIEFLYYN